MKKKIFAIIILTILTTPLIVQAQPNIGLNYALNLDLPALNNNDPHDVLVNVVRYLMTFLTLAAVVVIMLGGLRWMVSMGNDDRLAAAKKTIVSGLVGLALIMVSYALVNYIISAANEVLAGGNF